jgi:quercetin dioxygenase-like cupin family protein
LQIFDYLDLNRVQNIKGRSIMPDYTIVHLADVKDILGDYPGEMKMMKNDLQTEQVAITYRRMPANTGAKGSHGHRHKEQEEVTFVISGNILVKLDEKVLELKPHDAIRIAPQVVRGFWNEGPGDVELLIISNRLKHNDSNIVENFWED